MVSMASMICMCITLAVALLLPLVGLLVYALKYKKQGIVSAWFLGAAGFFVTQIIVRTNILGILGTQGWFLNFAQNNYIIYVLILAFTAGLFEFAGRFAVAKIMAKNLTYQRGFAAGLGHGGIEAILLIGMTYINNLLYAAMINSGMFKEVIAQSVALGVDVTPLYQVQDALINTASGTFLLAGYERILTMICHVALSLIVVYYVKEKQAFKGAVICIGLHTALDGISGLLSGLSTPYLGSLVSQNVTYVLVYVFLTVSAVVGLCYIRNIKGKMQGGSCKENEV